MTRTATIIALCGLLSVPLAAVDKPMFETVVRQPERRQQRTPDQIRSWAFRLQLRVIARKHGWDHHEEHRWLWFYEQGKIDWKDLTIAGCLEGYRHDRVLKEKWAGDDNEKRKALDLPLLATLAFGGSFANAGGDADGYQTGWGATTTSPQTIGAGGVRAIIQQLGYCYKLIGASETYVCAFQAYHPNGCSVRAALEGGAWETMTSRTYSSTHGAWAYCVLLATDPTKDSGRAEVRAEAIPVSDGVSAILGAATVGGSLGAGEERATAGEERIEFIFDNDSQPHFARLYTYVDRSVDIAVGSGTLVSLAHGDGVRGGTSNAVGRVVTDHAGGVTSLRLSVISGTFQNGETLDKGTVNEVSGAYTSGSTNVGTTTGTAVARGSDSAGFVATTEADCIPDSEGGNLTAAAAAASFAPGGGPKPFATEQAAAVAICDYRRTTSTVPGQTGLNAGVVYDRGDGGVVLYADGYNHACGGYSVSADIMNTDSAALELRPASHVAEQGHCVISAIQSSSGFRTRAIKLSNFRITTTQISTTASGYGTGGGSANAPLLLLKDCHYTGASNTDSTNGCDTDFQRVYANGVTTENRDQGGINITHFVNCTAINTADFMRRTVLAYGCAAYDLASAGATHEDAFQINATSPLVKSNVLHFANQCIDNSASQMLFWRINDNTSVVQYTAVIGYLVYSTKAAGNSSVWRTQTDLTGVTFQACTIASDHPFNMTDDSSGSYTVRAYSDVVVRDCVMWDLADSHSGAGSVSLDNNHYIDMAVPGADANGTTGSTADAIWITPGDDGDFHPEPGSLITGRTLNDSYEVDLEGVARTESIGALQLVGSGEITKVLTMRRRRMVA